MWVGVRRWKSQSRTLFQYCHQPIRCAIPYKLCSRVPSRYVWNVKQGKPLVLELPLPVVDLARAHAVFDDQFSHANAAALSFPEAHWRQLEGPFLAGLPFACCSALQVLPCFPSSVCWHEPEPGTRWPQSLRV